MSTKPGATITVTSTAGVTNFALVRMAATTHTVDTDQRRVPLKVTSANGATIKLAIPTDTGTVVPGQYMLFAINSAGTPSISQLITIS